MIQTAVGFFYLFLMIASIITHSPTAEALTGVTAVGIITYGFFKGGR